MKKPNKYDVQSKHEKYGIKNYFDKRYPGWGERVRKDLVLDFCKEKALGVSNDKYIQDNWSKWVVFVKNKCTGLKVSGADGWIMDWRNSGVSVQARTSHHYSLYRGDVRIDFWPKSRKFHSLDLKKRGVLSSSKDVLDLMDKVDGIFNEKRAGKRYTDEESINWLNQWYNMFVAGKKLKKKWDRGDWGMYELEGDNFVFAFSTEAKARPESLVMPGSVRDLVKRQGNSIYFDSRDDGAVIFYSIREVDFKFYNKGKDEAWNLRDGNFFIK